MHELEPPPLGDPVDSDATPSQLPHYDSVGRSEGGPGYPRHRDYSGFHHGGTDSLIRVELGYPHTNFDRWPEQTNGQEVEVMITTNDGGLGPVAHSFPRSCFPQQQRGRGTIKGEWKEMGPVEKSKNKHNNTTNPPNTTKPNQSTGPLERRDNETCSSSGS